MRKFKQGFNLIEIILAVGIFLFCVTAVLDYVSSIKRIRLGNVSTDQIAPNGLDIYSYGLPVCDFDERFSEHSVVSKTINLSGIISSSTLITGIHILDHNILLTTDSSSTTEPDILIGKIENENFTLESSKDVGPGVWDSVYRKPYLYIANTSVNSHVKVLKISDTISIEELQNIKIDAIVPSHSMPRSLNFFGSKLLVGTEKNSSGGELFSFDISTTTGLLIGPVHSLELDGQVHNSIPFTSQFMTATAGDPELRWFDKNFLTKNIYDAPLTLGNGKTLISLYPYIVFGRTLGSEELTLLKVDTASSTFTKTDTARTSGTVDSLVELLGTDFPSFLALTSNSQKEIQFWKISSAGQLSLIRSLDIPARADSFTCASDGIWLSLLINEQPHLIFIK